jgi:hypothetical protein
MSRSNISNEFEELDFLIEEEGWNEHELADGSRIKARTFLKKIIRDPNDPNNYRFDIQRPIYVVYAPPQNRGERNNPPKMEESSRLANYEVRTIRNDEPWNRYRILRTGQTIRLRLTVTEFRRVTDRFDGEGLPFYKVTSGPTVVVNPPADGLQP